VRGSGESLRLKVGLAVFRVVPKGNEHSFDLRMDAGESSTTGFITASNDLEYNSEH